MVLNFVWIDANSKMLNMQLIISKSVVVVVVGQQLIVENLVEFNMHNPLKSADMF